MVEESGSSAGVAAVVPQEQALEVVEEHRDRLDYVSCFPYLVSSCPDGLVSVVDQALAMIHLAWAGDLLLEGVPVAVQAYLEERARIAASEV